MRRFLARGQFRVHQHRGIALTVRDAINSALDEEMSRNEKVFLLGEEVANYDGAYKVTKGLVGKYGQHRVVDMPITEHGFAGMACGSAMNGMIPVCEFMTFNFALQAIDHLVNTAAKGKYMSGGQLSCPVVFRGPNGASLGVGAQHSQCLAPWLASVPGLHVVAPYSCDDARGLMKAAIRDPNPTVVLEHELIYGEKFEVSDEAMSPDYVIPFGKAKIEKVGSDITFVAFSKAVGIALQAATKLQELGIDAEVVNLRSLRPIDRDAIISSVKKTHRVVTVDESFPMCNIGAEVAAIIMESEAFDYLDAPLERVSCADVPTPYSKALEARSQPQVADVVEVAKRVCARRM